LAIIGLGDVNGKAKIVAKAGYKKTGVQRIPESN
jgi:hypothetical protein